MKKMLLSVLALCAISITAAAQETSTYTFERKISPDQSPQVLLDRISLGQAKVAVQTRTIPNAPYSGETTTETVQVLGDGNRIVRKSTTRVYRDSAGRTRQETVAADGQMTTVAINDPAAGVNYTFEPGTNTATRSNMMIVRYVTRKNGSGETVTSTSSADAVTASDERTRVETDLKAHVTVAEGAAGVMTMRVMQDGGPGVKGETTSEDLGQQTIEGVVAKGTRTTTLIPAGAIGNEQPLRAVAEEWFSPDLQVLVLTKHSDPRVGETTYRLTNVTRAEPAHSLFELPAGYTVKTPEGVSRFEIQKR
jgi:hypothetical protein